MSHLLANAEISLCCHTASEILCRFQSRALCLTLLVSAFFLKVFFGKLYDGIFVTGLVVTKVNYVILKINCQVIDGMVKRDGCGWLVSAWP